VQTEIVSSRRKTALMLLGSLGFVAIGFLLPGPPDSRMFWSGVFFSACAAVFAALLLRPQRLVLDQEGLIIPATATIAVLGLTGFIGDVFGSV
jgi:hypothetical protein